MLGIGITTETLSDGSQVFNLTLVQDGVRITLACVNQAAAMAAFDALKTLIADSTLTSVVPLH